MLIILYCYNRVAPGHAIIKMINNDLYIHKIFGFNSSWLTFPAHQQVLSVVGCGRRLVGSVFGCGWVVGDALILDISNVA